MRREQIIDAAVAVIAEQGIQNLSLSEIEAKVDMSRGQLTYYFKAKEEILLAVFDRTLRMMESQSRHADDKEIGDCLSRPFLEVFGQLTRMLMQDPPAHPEFNSLQYTFLSQISHREDFRQRLADLYERWRLRMIEHLELEISRRSGRKKICPRTLATVLQAILHGLVIQTAADPRAFDADKVVAMCLEMLNQYLGEAEPRTPPARPRTNSPVGRSASKKVLGSASGKIGVKHG